MYQSPLILKNVTKRFGAFTAVNDLSLEVEEGAIVGFLGPNGAGKSTSLRVALGVMFPDAGEVSLFGDRPNIDTLKNVGFLPEERGLYKKMTAKSTITHFARLKGLSANDARTRAVELLESAGLGDFMNERISKLSKGMAQKVQILSTLAHRPKFLILDEPFSGLDPVNQQALEDIIREEHARGATILFSTHVMEHAERVCDRIVMMAKGEKVFDGSLQDAFDALGKGARMSVEGDFDLAAALATKGFEAQRDSASDDEGAWRVNLISGQDEQDALRAALEVGAPITGFAPEQARLRDVFVKFAGEMNATDMNDSRLKEVANA